MPGKVCHAQPVGHTHNLKLADATHGIHDILRRSWNQQPATAPAPPRPASASPGDPGPPPPLPPTQGPDRKSPRGPFTRPNQAPGTGTADCTTCHCSTAPGTADCSSCWVCHPDGTATMELYWIENIKPGARAIVDRIANHRGLFNALHGHLDRREQWHNNGRAPGEYPWELPGKLLTPPPSYCLHNL